MGFWRDMAGSFFFSKHLIGVSDSNSLGKWKGRLRIQGGGIDNHWYWQCLILYSFIIFLWRIRWVVFGGMACAEYKVGWMDEQMIHMGSEAGIYGTLTASEILCATLFIYLPNPLLYSLVLNEY
ncbi:hypothetical protein EYC80_001843 [Monilinia laxa]|uniref:Uncharacterized protein n=1 Tax=Monilinia laxa TaxID=61186 RepID=A0A5N6K673_MONLA|nr:hypothetical protein EYC80_001843 [Monilinia laxa]